MKQLPLLLAVVSWFAGSLTGFAQDTPSAIGPVLKLYQSGRLPPARQAPVVEMICNRGNEHDLRVVFDQLVSADGMPDDLRLQAVGWLYDASATRKVKPTGDLSGLVDLVKSKNPRLRQAVIRLAAAWRVAEVAPTLEALAKAPETSPELRQVAIGGLVDLLGERSRDSLVALVGADHDFVTRRQAAAALVSVDLPVAAKQAAKLLADASPKDDSAPLLEAFFERKDGTDTLASELKTAKLNEDVAKRALRHMYSVGRNDAELSAVLSKAAGVAADPPPPTPEEVARLAEIIVKQGDSKRGEQIFRRADLSCYRCHSLNRAGGQVGPDLSAVGGSSPLDYVINSVLNPNLAVKEQYVTRVFETVDGKVFTGIVIDRDESRVRLRDSKGETIILPTSDIDFEGEGPSIMPAGLTKFLTKDELIDLVRFVSELGKPGPYAPPTVPTIYRWKRLTNPAEELTKDVPHLEHLRQFVFSAPDEAWSSVYARFDGGLPLAELKRNPETDEFAILKGEFTVTDGGTVEIAIQAGPAVQAWVDSQPVSSESGNVVTVESGRHAIIIRTPITDDPEATLKVQLLRPAEGSAQYEIVTGS